MLLCGSHGTNRNLHQKQAFQKHFVLQFVCFLPKGDMVHLTKHPTLNYVNTKGSGGLFVKVFFIWDNKFLNALTEANNLLQECCTSTFWETSVSSLCLKKK